MKNILIFIVFVGLVGCQPADEPAATVEPEAKPEETSLNAVDVDSDINTVEFENDWVRVIRIKAPAGHTSNRHTHEGGVFVSLTDGKSKGTVDGGDTNETETKLGDIGNTFDMVGVPHVTENLGDAESEGVMVELKIEGGNPIDAPSHDAVEVDGEHHTVEFENDRVRVVRMRYPDGHATPPHNHYPGVNIVLSDSRVASGPEGEDVEAVETVAGTASWADGGEPHVTRSLDGELHLVRVELKVN